MSEEKSKYISRNGNRLSISAEMVDSGGNPIPHSKIWIAASSNLGRLLFDGERFGAKRTRSIKQTYEDGTEYNQIFEYHDEGSYDGTIH